MKSLTALVLYFLMLTSCKPPDTPKAESAVLADAAPDACACDDLECWDRQTREGVSGQLSCVEDALGAAANLATAGGVAYAKVLIGASQLYSLGLATYKIAGEADAPNIVGLIKAILSGNSAALFHVFGANYSQAPGLACLLDANEAINGLFKVTNNIMAISNADDNPEAVVSVLKTLGAAASGLVSTLKTLDACAQLMRSGGPSAEIAESLSKVTKAWFNIMNGFNTVMAFANCGWQIGKGGAILVGNTMCLMDDLNKLSASKASLQRQRLEALNRPAPNQGTSAAQSCNDEPNNCNTFAMGKFGLWLGQQTYLSYATRTYLCADMCGNKGVGSGECQKYAEEIFQGDVPSCKPICNVSQCDAAIAACVSFCCDQDGSCVNTAHEKMRDYNR